MHILLLTVIGILLITAFLLSAKIYFMRRAAKEIADAFRDRLTEDTNTLIDVSSGDPYMRSLASEINVQLHLLRKERRRYEQGDLELKEAINNISHDLKTPLTAINGYLDLLEREEKSESVQWYISCIENRTKALIDLTEELFRYSTVVSVKALNLKRTDLVRTLEESLFSFYFYAVIGKKYHTESRSPGKTDMETFGRRRCQSYIFKYHRQRVKIFGRRSFGYPDRKRRHHLFKHGKGSRLRRRRKAFRPFLHDRSRA